MPPFDYTTASTPELARHIARLSWRRGADNVRPNAHELALLGAELADRVLHEHGMAGHSDTCPLYCPLCGPDHLGADTADAGERGGFCWQHSGHEGACGNTGVELVAAADACGKVFGPLIRDDHSASRRVDVLLAEAPHLVAPRPDEAA